MKAKTKYSEKNSTIYIIYNNMHILIFFNLDGEIFKYTNLELLNYST